MPDLLTFDRALADFAAANGDAWSEDGLIFVGQLVANLSGADLLELRSVWRKRPLLWQKYCAEVLDQARHGEALPLLMEMVDRGAPDVALAALESLRVFHPSLFSAAQTARVLAALESTQARPIGPLHKAVLEAFLESLRSKGSAGDKK